MPNSTSDTTLEAPVILPANSSETESKKSASLLGDNKKRQRWFELVLVTFLSFSSFIVQSIYALRGAPGTQTILDSRRAALGVLQETGYLLLLAYVLSRTGRKFRDLGLKWSLRDIGVGLAVSFVGYFAYAIGYRLIWSAYYALYGAPEVRNTAALFGHAGFLALPFILINPFFEELIVRAYVMTEIIELTSSTALAIFLSTAIQFSYHLYYGWMIALAISCEFLVFSVTFAIFRRALPVIVAHAMSDLAALSTLW